MRSIAFIFLILVSCACAKENSFMLILEEKFQEILKDYAGYVASWFQRFNDEHLGKTEMGRLLNYEDMKPRLEMDTHGEGRGTKKMGTALMPLVFHVGAATTWMLLTTLLTAKTLAVGLALLVFKIAAGSAKLASFFTLLKHGKEDHHDYASAWSPHYEHHVHSSHKRDSESDIDPRIQTSKKTIDDLLPNTGQYKVVMGVSIATRRDSNMDYHLEHHPDHHGTSHTDWTHNIPHNFHQYSNEFHDSKNNEFHDSYNNEFHDSKNNEFHDSKNNELHNYNTHEHNTYKTITPHDIDGSSDSSHGDLEGH